MNTFKENDEKITETRNQKLRAEKIVAELETLYPNAKCSLEYDDSPWKLLVMARLSAQCTDERVNIVCKELFRKYPTLQSLAKCNLAELEEIIRPCGLFLTKAQSIKAACEKIVEIHGGEIPDNMQDLLALPGVGRKTANLVLGDIFKKGGIVADTHCMRISVRLALAAKRDPIVVERELSKIIPTEKQSDFCHRLVIFGREICTAKNPRCEECSLKQKKLCEGATEFKDGKTK